MMFTETLETIKKTMGKYETEKSIYMLVWLEKEGRRTRNPSLVLT
jgi:hypothetical protein